jgi:hypothetical protein
MRKVDGPSSRTPAVKLGILDAFRRNGPDGMWLITGDPSPAPSKTADTTRSTIAAANFRSSRTRAHPVLAVSGIGCGFCGSSRSRMAFKAWV